MSQKNEIKAALFESTEKAGVFKFPTAASNPSGSLIEGYAYWNTTAKELRAYDGSSFLTVGPSVGGGSGLSWTKYTVDYSVVQALGGTQADVVLFTLPAKGSVYAVVMSHTVNFRSPDNGISTFGAGVGPLGAENVWLSGGYMLDVNAGGSHEASGFLSNFLIASGNISSTIDIIARFTSAGAENLGDLTQGSVDFYVMWDVLP
jgi:hypothetical protein